MSKPDNLLDEHALNKAVQCYIEYPPRAEIRKLVVAIIQKYLEYSNKKSVLVHRLDGSKEIIPLIDGNHTKT